jgi:ribonuclease HII
MLVYETGQWEAGCDFVAGVDEAGRGPLAGPLVVAAVIFPKFSQVPFVDDSKKLSPEQRADIRKTLLAFPGIRWSVIEISAAEIDRLDILRAVWDGMRRALTELGAVDFALVDGLRVPGLPVPSKAIVKGDSKSASIAAASILAKERRDEIMREMALKYPLYGFEIHKGYATGAHIEAVRRHGPCEIHRKTFSPVKEILSPPPEQMSLGI